MNKALILVVEDDRPIRNLIVTTLKTHDYKYLTAENGASLTVKIRDGEADTRVTAVRATGESHDIP